MDDSWPGARPDDGLSDSISSHAAELDRTLRALEAVETFRAEAAALRAELHAARATPERLRPPLRNPPTIDLPEATWRLILEAGLLIGVAFAAWGAHLSRLEIVLVMVGSWIFVAFLEAAAFRRSEGVVPARPIPPPPAAFFTPPPPQVALSAPPPAAVELTPWPARVDNGEPTTVLPAPEPALEPEPAVVAEDSQPGPETDPAPADELDEAPSPAPKPVRFRRLRRRRDASAPSGNAAEFLGR